MARPMIMLAMLKITLKTKDFIKESGSNCLADDHKNSFVHFLKIKFCLMINKSIKGIKQKKKKIKRINESK